MRRPTVLDGKYSFEYDVGQWTYGTVRVLKERSTSDMKVCKVVPKAGLRFTSDMFERLQGLMSLQHPHLSSITDVLEDQESFYIVSDHYIGGDVQDWLERLEETNWVQEETCAAYVRQALLAVAHCHALQVYHGDLRPSSLILTSKMPDAAIKVCDVGLASILDPDGRIMRRHGNPYTSPDFVQADGDIWSIGALAHMLLTGKPPGDEAGGVAPSSWSFTRAEPEDDAWADRSDRARGFVQRCLRMHGERPTAAKLLWHPWLKGMSPLTRQMLHSDSDVAREVRHKTLCYHLALLLLPVVVPYKDFEDLRQGFVQGDPDRDGLISRQAAQRLLLSRCNFLDAVAPALSIVDVAKTDVFDLCGAACADLIVREFFAAGPTNSPLMGPFTSTGLASRMLARFFETFGSRQGGAAATCCRDSIEMKTKTQTLKDLELHCKVDFEAILDCLPENDPVDSQVLTSCLCGNGGRGTPLGADGELSPLARPNVWTGFFGLRGLFKSCGVGAVGREDSPDSIRIA